MEVINDCMDECCIGAMDAGDACDTTTGAIDANGVGFKQTCPFFGKPQRLHLYPLDRLLFESIEAGDGVAIGLV